MAYVIAEPCVATCTTACVEVCPMDCIAGPVSVEELRAVPEADRAARFGRIQLFIDPALCIDCGACQPTCPVEAIYPDVELPARWSHFADVNARFYAGA